MAVETEIKSSYDAKFVEDNEKGDLTPAASGASLQYDEETVKKIKRKIDVRLCVVVAIMYTVCQVDRINLANAYDLSSLQCMRDC
jgi:hypothetical protein